MTRLTLEYLHNLLDSYVPGDVFQSLVEAIHQHEEQLIGEDEPVPSVENRIHYDFVYYQSKLRGKQRQRRLGSS